MTQFNSFSSGGSTSVAISGVNTPSIQNVTITLAATEETITLPAGTRRFMIKTRTENAKMQISYVSGESGTQYLTLIPGAVYKEDGIDAAASVSLYVQSNKASTVVELVSWA